MKKYPLLVQVQRWWLFLFIVMIPFSTGYIFERPVAFSYINLFSIVFILLGAVNAATGVVPLRKLHDRPTLGALAIFFATLAYALLFTHPLRDGIGVWGSRLVQPALVGYGVYLLLEAGFLKLSEIAAALLASLIPQIVGGFLQASHILPYKDTTRVTVAYQWPNTFARYIMTMLLLTYPWLLAKVPASLKRPAWIVWGLGVLLLLSSISYNGTVSFCIGLGLVTLLLPRDFTKLKIWVIAVLAVSGILITTNASKLPKWQASIGSSRETRLEFWHVAVGAIKDHPLTGIGLKTWEHTYPQLLVKYATKPFLSLTSPQPHNFILDSLLKAGVFGFIAIPLFLLWPAVTGLKIIRRSRFAKTGWFGLAVIGSSVALFCFGFIDDPIWSDDMMPLLFILLLGAAYCYSTVVTRGQIENDSKTLS
ncbi:MAG: O-antigen ligase family protein [bacterium]